METTAEQSFLSNSAMEKCGSEVAITVLVEPKTLILNQLSLSNVDLEAELLIFYTKDKRGVHAWLAIQHPIQFRIQDNRNESKD